MELSWLTKSIVATFCLAPIILASSFFSGNYNVRPETTIIWYFIGIVLGAIPYALYTKLLTPQELLPQTTILLIILLMGITLGTASNLFIFQALATAPNPSLPMAISNAITPIVLITSIVLSVFLPQYFGAVKIDWLHCVGILFVISGVTIIALHK